MSRPERVRVTAPRAVRRPPGRAALRSLDDRDIVDELLMGSLVRAQLELALRLFAVLGELLRRDRSVPAAGPVGMSRTAAVGGCSPGLGQHADAQGQLQCKEYSDCVSDTEQDGAPRRSGARETRRGATEQQVEAGGLHGAVLVGVVVVVNVAGGGMCSATYV